MEQFFDFPSISLKIREESTITSQPLACDLYLGMFCSLNFCHFEGGRFEMNNLDLDTRLELDTSERSLGTA